MGYTTDFTGSFTITPALQARHKAYLHRFSSTRRMKRDAKAKDIPDPLREAVGLPLGADSGYFVAAEDGQFGFGQGEDPSVVDHNAPPKGQPGLWCQWTPSEDGSALEWDGGEKFYDYTEWLEYLIEHFLKTWRYVLSGEVKWQGEESSDRGVIYADSNRVEAVHDNVRNLGPSWGKGKRAR